MSLGRVGAPLGCCDIRLVDWEEGNYRVTDSPFPRGEVLIGGDNVSLGYFKLPSQTNEEFFVEGGRRWFRSGDIAEVHPDGVMKIIGKNSVYKCGVYFNLAKYSDVSKYRMIVRFRPKEGFSKTAIRRICQFGKG